MRAFSDFSDLKGMAIEVTIVMVVGGLGDSKYIEGGHVSYVGFGVWVCNTRDGNVEGSRLREQCPQIAHRNR